MKPDLMLRPLQKEAVTKMLHFLRTNPERGCYNASSCGTGKTAQTITVLNELNPATTLIICPSIVKINWTEEIQMWSKRDYDVSVWLINSSKDIKGQQGLSTFTVISYELARQPKVIAWLEKQNIDVLVLDEVQKCKNPKSQITKTVLKRLWPKANYRICLSGTPFTNTIEDCYTTFSRLAPSVFPNWFNFVNTFCYMDRTNWGVKYFGLKNAELLYKIIRKHFFFRYSIQDMVKELPPVIWTKITLPYKEYAVIPTEEEKEEHKVYLKLLEEAIGAGKGIPQPSKNHQVKRREQGSRKLPAVKELCEDLLETNSPVLVFFIYLENLFSFMKTMKEYKPSVIYGAVPEKGRHECIRAFQAGETNLFCGQIAAMNTGINLQRADNVVFAEMDYSPATIHQAVSRSSRMGRTTSVNAFYPVVQNTIEEEIVRAVMSKDRIFNKILSDNVKNPVDTDKF